MTTDGVRIGNWFYWQIITRNYKEYNTLAGFDTINQSTLISLVPLLFTIRFLATDLNTETITSNHHEVFLPFLVQSPWTADSPELDPILQFQFSNPSNCKQALVI
jgi:hypothetical protein